MSQEKDAYQKLVEGFTLLGQGLQEINDAKQTLPINILVSKLVGRLGLNDPEIIDELSMLRFAVVNKDYGLEKLTALVMGFDGPVEEPIGAPEVTEEPVAESTKEPIAAPEVTDEPVEAK